MTPLEAQQRTIRELLLRLSSGEASEEEHAQFCELVLNEPAARSYAVALLHQLAALESLGGTLPREVETGAPVAADLLACRLDRVEQVPAPPHAPTSSPAHRPFLSHMNTWGSLAASFAIGVVSTLLLLRGIGPEDEPLASLPKSAPIAPLETPAPIVARLVSNTGHIWSSNDGYAIETGAEVKTRETIGLQEGVAQFDFDNGVTLYLEGPAAMSVDEQGKPLLQYGQMLVEHPNDAKPFEIETEVGQIILNSGSQLGLIQVGGEVQAHLFRGTATLHPEGGTPLHIEHPVAYLVSRGPMGDWRSFRREALPQLFSLPKSAKPSLLAIDDAYADAVKSDRPIAYWRFDEIVEGTIPNVVSSAHPLEVHGTPRILTRGANGAMNFGLGPDEGYLVSADRFDELKGQDYTVECFIMPERYYQGSVLAMAHRRSEEREIEGSALLLELIGDLRTSSIPSRSLRFLHRSPPGASASLGTSLYSPAHYRTRVWQHVAAMKEGRDLRLYVDGNLMANGTDSTEMVDDLTLVVGQLFTFASSRPYVGMLDELAIYDYALPVERIALRCEYLRSSDSEHE